MKGQISSISGLVVAAFVTSGLIVYSSEGGTASAQITGTAIHVPDKPCVISTPPPLSPLIHGFKAEYYRGWAIHRHYPDNLSTVRIDGNVAFSDDGTSGTQPWNLPYPTDPVGFSVRWTATFTAPLAGSYHFWLNTGDEDGGLILLDGVEVLDVEDLQHFQSTSRPVDLTEGPHFLEVYYRHTDGLSQARLSFQTPSAPALVPIPSNLLSPTILFGTSAHRITATDMSPDSLVVDQFAASEGVTFVPSPVTSNGSYSSRPTVVGDCPKIIYNDSFDAASNLHDIPSRQPLTVIFAQPQLRVKVFVGTAHDYSGTSIQGGPHPAALLRAYNSAGELLGVDYLDSVSAPVTSMLQIGRWEADISAITISFDRSNIGERISALIFENNGSSSVSPDTTPPNVSILSPLDGAYVAGPTIVVRAMVTDNSGLVDSVASGTVALALDRAVTPGCNFPICRVYSGSVNVALGFNTLTVVARDHAGNLGQSRTHIGVGTTLIHVVDDNGQNVSDAQIFLNGILVGSTDSSGRSDLTPAATSGRLVARWLARSVPVDHPHSVRDARNGWLYHIYFTSLSVNNDGTTSPFNITEPSRIQELRISNANVLIGLHLLATLEWDASLDELSDFSSRMQQSSQFLYNATDGQLYVESYDLEDDMGGWDDADFQIHADQCLRSVVPWHPGGFMGSFWLGRGRAQMGPNVSNGCFNGNGAPNTFAHEFGHYGFDLFDEYSDDDPGIMCTAGLRGSGSFSSSADKAACMMYKQWEAGKLCSDRSENPHVHNTSQGDESCWHHFAGRFNDSQGHWVLRTPDSRGAIPGTLPALLGGWSTSIVKTDYARPALCNSSRLVYQVVDPSGNSIPNTDISLHTTYGTSIVEGQTDNNGTISIRGGHVGDQVAADQVNASVTIGSLDCQRVLAFGTPLLPAQRIVAKPMLFDLRAALEPMANAGDALLRLSTGGMLSSPPSIMVTVNGRKPQEVQVKFDSKSKTYLGHATGLPSLATISIAVSARNQTQENVRRSFSAILSPSLPEADVDLASVDGHLEIHIPGGALPKDSSVIIGPSTSSGPKLGDGVRILSGPYHIYASSRNQLDKPATIRIFLSPSPHDLSKLEIEPMTLTFWYYDSTVNKWESVKGTFNQNLDVVTARVEQLSDFVLTVGLPRKPTN